MVDTPVLEAGAVRREGSSPSLGTIGTKTSSCLSSRFRLFGTWIRVIRLGGREVTYVTSRTRRVERDGERSSPSLGTIGTKTSSCLSSRFRLFGTWIRVICRKRRRVNDCELISSYVHSFQRLSDKKHIMWKTVRIPDWILSAFVLGDRIPLTHFLWKKIFIQNMQPWRSYARVAIHSRQEVLSCEMRYVSKHVLSVTHFILVRKHSWRQVLWTSSTPDRRRLSHSMRVKINSVARSL